MPNLSVEHGQGVLFVRVLLLLEHRMHALRHLRRLRRSRFSASELAYDGGSLGG
jgi:hypothetical protein